MLPVVENIGKLERRVTLSILRETVQKEIEARLLRLARKSRMSGFRPGKVPLKIIQAQHGKQVEIEVLGEYFHQEFFKFSHVQNLKVIGQPHFSLKERKEGEADDKSYALDATFEIYPEIEIRLDDLATRRISRPTTTISDPEIDRTLEVLRRQKVQYTLRNEQPNDENTNVCAAQPDDRVTLDIEGMLEEKPFSGGSTKDLVAVLGSNALPPEFETVILGLKIGETTQCNLTFPAEHPNPELANKTVQFKLTLKKTEQPRYPEVDADFVTSLGIVDGDLAKMRAEIKENLERETQRRIRLLTQRQVMDCLLECATLEIPHTLVEQDQRRLAETTRRDMEKRGMPNHAAQISEEMFKAQAERRVKLGLICAELIKQYDLRAKPEQVRAAVETRSKSYQEPQEIVRWYYADAQRLAEVEAEVAESNIIDFVLSKTQIEDQPLDFEALANASY